MKKLLRALKDSWEFLCEPVVFRNYFWYMITLAFIDIVSGLILKAFWYYYG